MVWNPSPKVTMARDFGKKFDKKMVIILSFDDKNQIEYTSYGRDKSLCENAKQIGDYLFEKLINDWIPFG